MAFSFVVQCGVKTGLMATSYGQFLGVLSIGNPIYDLVVELQSSYQG
jgi:hypothetical protein